MLKPARFSRLCVVLAGFALLTNACQNSPDDTIPLPTGSPFPPELESRLHGIRDKALEIRSLRLDKPVNESMLSREELRAYFDQVQSEIDEDDRAEMEVYNDAWRLLRLIGPEDDLVDLFLDSDAEDILGFYADEHERLVLISDKPEITQDDEWVIAHEYVHSFQHGAFDTDSLRKLEDDEEEEDATEYAVTTSCLTEGEATLATILYAEQVFGPGWNDGPDAEDEAAETPIPPAIERYQAFDYNECALWAASLYGQQGGWLEIDKAYQRPPWTTEQILHPEKYLAREAATGLRPIDISERLGGDWEQLDGGIFGEFDVWNYLLTITGDEGLAGMGAGGWGVGWATIYGQEISEGTAESPVLIHLALEFDTEADLGEFLIAYGTLVDRVAPGTSKADFGKRTVCWDVANEFGYVGWSDSQNRADIVISTQAGARDGAIAGSLSSQTSGACPA